MNKLAVAATAVIVVAAVATWQRFGTSPREERVELLDPTKVEMIRTPGGLLEVSAMEKVEEFGWRTSWDCPLVDCSGLPKTVSKVRVKAHYGYQIPLAAEWRLEPQGDHYRLTVPALQLRQPVAFDTATLAIETDNGVFSPAAAPHRENAIRHIGAELAQRGTSAAYLDAQQRTAEKTVREFAQKWMMEQGRKPTRPITVLFTGPNPL
ncbi:hypothetical protein WG902_05470 [Ramlibacter sp. PS3R-8]|uniref:hypothetical protein n=1 Tax=Ramlibacter sp. PS3R-8 TaxID=3133437 RepID=UPI003098FEF3